MTGVRARQLSLRRIVPAETATLIAAAIIALLIVLAVAGASAFGLDPKTQNLLTVLQMPSQMHWLGTDELGRDVLARVIDGARRACVGPLLVALGSAMLATAMGLLAGYVGGSTDWIIGKIIELLIAIPTLLKIIVIVGVTGGGYVMSVLLLILFSAPYDARVVRGTVLQHRGLAYVEAARATGLSRSRIMFAHILPAIAPIIVALAFVNFAWALVNLASLSFLGLGGEAGSADWGRMLADNRRFLRQNAWAALAPGLALIATATAMNILGDRVNEYLADTK